MLSGWLWEEADKGLSRVHALFYDTSVTVEDNLVTVAHMSVLLLGGQDGSRHIQILPLATDS